MSAIFMRDASLIIDSDEFSASLTSVAITPTTTKVVGPTLNREVSYADVSEPTYTLDAVAYFEEEEDSLFVYAWQNHGVAKDVIVKAKKVGGRSYSCRVVFERGTVGGAVNTQPTVSFSFSVLGDVTMGPLTA